MVKRNNPCKGRCVVNLAHVTQQSPVTKHKHSTPFPSTKSSFSKKVFKFPILVITAKKTSQNSPYCQQFANNERHIIKTSLTSPTLPIISALEWLKEKNSENVNIKLNLTKLRPSKHLTLNFTKYQNFWT